MSSVRVRKFDSWAKTECDLCDTVFQVTRSFPVEIKGQVICNDCEMLNNGIEQGKEIILNEIELCDSMGEISKLLRQYGR